MNWEGFFRSWLERELGAIFSASIAVEKTLCVLESSPTDSEELYFVKTLALLASIISTDDLAEKVVKSGKKLLRGEFDLENFLDQRLLMLYSRLYERQTIDEVGLLGACPYF